MQAAHDVGVVHRDLKPGNLMILYPGTPLEQLRLMDFGLAKMSSLLYISPDELFDYTLPPAAGTPEYIAPEQVRGNEMDGRGDLYSVGVLLYEMLTGRRPFVGDSVQELMHAHAEQPPPTFAELGLAEQIPPAVERVVALASPSTPTNGRRAPETCCSAMSWRWASASRCRATAFAFRLSAPLSGAGPNRTWDKRRGRHDSCRRRTTRTP